MTVLLAHTTHGAGPSRVIVLHDWLGDSRTWDPVLPYLDTEQFTYTFVDLRGYGGSRELRGAYSAAEAAGDVLALADALEIPSFAAVGHSMSGLIVQELAASAPGRVSKIVGVSPVGPGGLPMPPEVRSAMELLATDVPRRLPAVQRMLGDRWTPRWAAVKAERWIACSTPEAVLGYLRMYAQTDLRPRVQGLAVPLLLVGCEHDAPWFQPGALDEAFACYPGREVVSCGNAGHYPMQETPVALVSLIEPFLARPVDPPST